MQDLTERRVRKVIHCTGHMRRDTHRHQAASQFTIALTAGAAGPTHVSPGTGLYKPIGALR